ncbi:unnamed protein product, partial [Choristocarpus tenellus]
VRVLPCLSVWGLVSHCFFYWIFLLRNFLELEKCRRYEVLGTGTLTLPNKHDYQNYIEIATLDFGPQMNTAPPSKILWLYTFFFLDYCMTYAIVGTHIHNFN